MGRGFEPLRGHWNRRSKRAAVFFLDMLCDKKNWSIFATDNPKDMKEYIFEIEMKVRDYECDLQCIVNNANYQHYMEHARHEFLESAGANFGQLHLQGIDAMVSHAEIDYKVSLISGDRFIVRLNIAREGVKLVFFEDIYRLSDNRLCAKGRVESICVDHGRLTRGELFDEIFKNYLKKEEK